MIAYIILRIYMHIRLLLIPFIPVYLLIFYLKRYLSTLEKFDIPVICIGNITSGGTGKTPAVIEFAGLLKKLGRKPGIVSRGYHGAKSGSGAIVSNRREILLSSREAGDEPFLIAGSLKGVPVAICRNRPVAVRRLINEFSVDIIIMDDGFQNNSLRKDINIIIIDATKPFGNGLLIPAGDMREPLSSLGRADMIILNKSDLIPGDELNRLFLILKKVSGSGLIYTARYEYDYLYQAGKTNKRIPVTGIKGKRILVICAVGNPAALLKGLKKYNPLTIKLYPYPDHHLYNEYDLKKIKKKSGAYDMTIITEKDFVKMSGFSFDNKIYVLKISMMIDKIDMLKDYIMSYL